jgi:two-component system alkaline phosphatase synthesis response regulator PhoP
LISIIKIKGKKLSFHDRHQAKVRIYEYQIVNRQGSLSIDKDKYKVVFKKHELFLPRKEFELLYLLASKPGKVFKRDNIMENVWGNEVIVGDRTIDVHIRKLREKLGDHFLKTIKGVGYKFIEPEN